VTLHSGLTIRETLELNRLQAAANHPERESQVVDIYGGASYVLEDGLEDKIIASASFPPGATVGRISCYECAGSGWWGYGPVEETNGECIDCKGTGRIWVGLA
jgi:hypothetical protein